MALEDKLDHILNLCQAAAQRQQTISDLAAKLRDGSVWRSADGKLSIPMSGEQKDQIKDLVEGYCTDLENITQGIRLALAGPPP